LLALHRRDEPWDGMITTDSSMLSLPKELSLLCQTKLTQIVAEETGHDPIRATGLVLAHIDGICKKTRRDVAQVWTLRTTTREHTPPWELLTRIAQRHGTTANDLYAAERLTADELG
jgi:hypothetical protein